VELELEDEVEMEMEAYLLFLLLMLCASFAFDSSIDPVFYTFSFGDSLHLDRTIPFDRF
jgi:hypothetical protein